MRRMLEPVCCSDEVTKTVINKSGTFAISDVAENGTYLSTRPDHVVDWMCVG